MLERARPAHHHLSLNNALTYSGLVFYWSGRYEECGRYVELLAEHVTRQGLITRRPIASFYRAALAHTQGDASSKAIDGLKRAIEEFRNVNYLARMPYYLSVLADALVHLAGGSVKLKRRSGSHSISHVHRMKVGAFQNFCDSRRPF